MAEARAEGNTAARQIPPPGELRDEEGFTIDEANPIKAFPADVRIRPPDHPNGPGQSRVFRMEP